MTLSRSAYRKLNADPARSAGAQKGAWKRTINERRIEGLQNVNAQLLAALEAMYVCGEIRAWEHSTSSIRQQEAMKLARAALAKAKG